MNHRCLLSIVLFNFLIFSTIKSQITNTATIRLLLLNDSNNQPLETNIKWHSLKTNKDFYFKTDKNGKATVSIQGNDTYETSITQSLDEYNVEVPNDPNFQKDLVLKFELEKTIPQKIENKPNIVQTPSKEIKIEYQNLIGLQILNKPKGKRLDIYEIESQKKIRTIERDTQSFGLLTERHYKLVIEGMRIENDTMNVLSYSPKMVPYILYFSSDNSARLYAINNTTVINLILKNLLGEKTSGDTIRIVGKKSGNQYEAVTAKNGSALFIVPKDDSYEISLKYFPKIRVINTESSLKTDLATFSYEIICPTTFDIDKRNLEFEKFLARRDSLFPLPDPELLSKLAAEKDSVLRQFGQDPHYFEKTKNVVCAVLNRFRNRWTDKVIVTDVTAGMYPFMKELALWHALDFMKDEKNTYVFFNDGDDKVYFQKVIGRIGGIYMTHKNTTDTIVRIMHYAMSRGNGGEPPENNVEALIVAEQYALPFSEMVMIADSYSPIKDLVLVPKLKKPVRIILCRVNPTESIHPDYLWLAYKTRGSIHTIDEDIMNLSTLVEGDNVTVLGRTYKLLSNRFFEIR